MSKSQWGDAKPIETVYKGYRFRSRLEARWAVFFDAAGVEWAYEPEGFDLDGVWYLPDFYLPKIGCWIEIKPTAPSWEELTKVLSLSRHTARNAYLFVGLPGDYDEINGGYGFGEANGVEFGSGPYFGWSECPYCGFVGIAGDWGAPERMECCGKPQTVEDDYIALLEFLSSQGNVMIPDSNEFSKGHRFRSQWAGHWGKDSPLLLRAFLAAKQARFEKGKR